MSRIKKNWTKRTFDVGFVIGKKSPPVREYETPNCLRPASANNTVTTRRSNSTRFFCPNSRRIFESVPPHSLSPSMFLGEKRDEESENLSLYSSGFCWFLTFKMVVGKSTDCKRVEVLELNSKKIKFQIGFETFEDKNKNSKIYLWTFHSHSRKNIRRRVRLQNHWWHFFPRHLLLQDSNALWTLKMLKLILQK